MDRRSKVRTGTGWLSRAPECQAPGLAGSGGRLGRDGQLATVLPRGWISTPCGSPHRPLPCHLPCPGHKPAYSPWPPMDWAAVVVRGVGAGLLCDRRWAECPSWSPHPWGVRFVSQPCLTVFSGCSCVYARVFISRKCSGLCDLQRDSSASLSGPRRI